MQFKGEKQRLMILTMLHSIYPGCLARRITDVGPVLHEPAFQITTFEPALT